LGQKMSNQRLLVGGGGEEKNASFDDYQKPQRGGKRGED